MRDQEIGRALQGLVGGWLAWHKEMDRRERAAELTDLLGGYRVVNGGQTDSDGSWEVTDAATGEVLARGVGREPYDAAWQDSWAHVDAISDGARAAVPEPDGDFGLPEGLARALRDWVVDCPDEAREVLSN